MYNKHFGFSQAPFNVTPDARFNFVNPCFEEVLATLRYGIDARKGLTVVTGEAGTGKTTLLKTVVQSLPLNVRSVCLFDPPLSFPELLYRTFSELGITGVADGRLAMMAQLNDYLVRQLKNNQTVVLMIDEAQNLSFETLEELRLLLNFETDNEKLIQIVLAGLPALWESLNKTNAQSLKQRISLRSRLRPLECHEVGAYIKSRLSTVNCLRENLFDADSVKRIAFYSQGIPRVINVICDNALISTYTRCRNRVSVDEIDDAVHELRLVENNRVGIDPAVEETVMTTDPYEDRTHQDAGVPRCVTKRVDRPAAETDPFLIDLGERPAGWPTPTKSPARKLGVYLMFAVATGSALSFYSPEIQNFVSNLVSDIRKISAFSSRVESLEPKGSSPSGPRASHSDTAADTGLAGVASPNSSVTPLAQAASNPEIADDLESKNTANLREKPAKHEPSKIPPIVTSRHVKHAVNVNEIMKDRRLELEITKALQDHAIEGVQVSVNQGTIYLDGHVATARQKVAAIRVVLGVPRVSNIQNRITFSE